MKKILIGVMFAFAFISCETDGVKGNDLETSYKESVDIVIANWDWGRESRNCERGFGVCNFDWGPQGPPTLPPITPPTLPPDWGVPPMGPGPGGGGGTSGGMSAPVVIEDGRVIIDLFVLEPGLHLQETKMIIDREITKELRGNLYKLSAGEIEYSPQMGQYGGYRLVFQML